MKTFFFSLFILSNISVFASNDTTDFMTILTNNVWATCDKEGNINDGNVKIRFSASPDTLMMLLEENGKIQKMTAEYYLSSTPDTTFNESKIGNREGEYVIVKSSQPEGYIILTINSFSDKCIEYTFRAKINSEQEYIYDSVVIAVDN